MLGISVLDAAKRRISETFDRFQRICVSFSGGKDSTCMLHLVMEEAISRSRKVDLVFIDWEAQYKLVIDHVKECFDLYADHVIPHWICSPLRTENGGSMIDPEWTSWEPGKEAIWVRGKPAGSISEFPFHYDGIYFEEFVPEFSKWLAGGEDMAVFVGIRCGESLHRWSAVMGKNKERVSGIPYSTKISSNVFNIYPIYDWVAEDDWTYLGQSGKCYSRLYDRMYQAGVPLEKMRVCEPYGPYQRRGLWLFQIIEPETWPAVVARVSGANYAALYAKDRGGILGHGVIEKPARFTWKEYARFLLDTMPPSHVLHYENKIAVWVKWHKDRGVEISEELRGDTGRDMPSWRRVCKVILHNDYWCRGLSFGPTKTSAYGKYLDLMKRRRVEWGSGVGI